jgi:hypothetical protein
MQLDGSISNLPAGLVFLAVFVVGGNWLERKNNPPPAKYRKDGGLPWIGFWNLFDESKFTPEAIEYHRRRLRSMPYFIAAFVLGWILVDLIW